MLFIAIQLDKKYNHHKGWFFYCWKGDFGLSSSSLLIDRSIGRFTWKICMKKGRISWAWSITHRIAVQFTEIFVVTDRMNGDAQSKRWRIGGEGRGYKYPPLSAGWVVSFFLSFFILPDYLHTYLSIYLGRKLAMDLSIYLPYLSSCLSFACPVLSWPILLWIEMWCDDARHTTISFFFFSFQTLAREIGWVRALWIRSLPYIPTHTVPRHINLSI